MKRLFAAISILFSLALVSCKKELEPIAQQEVGTENVISEGKIKLNLSISDKAGSNTKAIKTGWEDGDKVYLFFQQRYVTNTNDVLFALITYNDHKWEVSSGQEGIDTITKEGFLYSIYVAGGMECRELILGGGFTYGVASTYESAYPEIQEAECNYTLENDTITASLDFSQVCTQIVITGLNAEDGWAAISPTGEDNTRFNGVYNTTIKILSDKSMKMGTTFYGFDSNAKIPCISNADGIAFYAYKLENTSKAVEIFLHNVKLDRLYRKSFPEGRSLQLGKAYKITGPELDKWGNFINANGWEYAVTSNKILYTLTSPEAELSLSLIGGDFYKTFGANMTEWAYYTNANYGEIIFDNAVTKVDYSTFRNKLTLQTITLPDSVQEIGIEAFSGCANLQEINIPKQVTSIGIEAFYGCSSLQEVNIPKRVTVISTEAFYGCSSLQEVNIPKRVTVISTEAFYGCSSLQELIIPRGITTINSRAFESCTNLQKIELPEGLIKIHDLTFSNCTSLSEITFPESLTHIGSRSFNGCAFTNITIPKNVRTIGGSAFSLCSHLKRFYCQATTPPSLDDDISLGTPQFIIVPNGSVDTYRNDPRWSKYTDIIFDLSNLSYIYYTTTDGQAHNPDESNSFCAKIYSNTYENNQGVITLLSNNTTIESYIFSCDFLTSITLPEGISTIGASAFHNCSNLTSITLPESISTIGNKAFYQCSNLTSITLPENVNFIGEYAFRECGSLSSIYCKNPTPPSLGVDVFQFIHSSAKIYVPSESVEAYKSAEGWSTYADMIVAGDF